MPALESGAYFFNIFNIDVLLDLIFMLDKSLDESYLTNLLKKCCLRLNEYRYDL